MPNFEKPGPGERMKTLNSEDDVEGHNLRRKAGIDGSDEDDVEGHGRKGMKIDGSDEDDVEGHGMMTK